MEASSCPIDLHTLYFCETNVLAYDAPCPPTGVIGQHALVNPPVTTPPQQLGHPSAAGIVPRLPIGVDQLPSPVHPNPGGSLVRPVPQQASPVRVSMCIHKCVYDVMPWQWWPS